MACFTTSRYSCFGPYYPCHVWTSVCRCDSNTVVNPVIEPNWAFLALTTATTVASGGTIPMALVASSGTAITSTTPGEVTLTAGTYNVNYNVSSLLGASGTNSFGFTINGTPIPASVSTISGTAGDAVSTSNSVVLTIMSQTALRLVNLGVDPIVVNVANLSIQKIA